MLRHIEGVNDTGVNRDETQQVQKINNPHLSVPSSSVVMSTAVLLGEDHKFTI